MSKDLTVSEGQTEFSEQQIAVLSQIGVQDASDADLAVFFHQVQRTGLDPFARQIYMIGRRQKVWDPETRQERWTTKQTIQTGIDGFRLIARRAADKSGEALSISQPYFATPDGKWLDFWPYDKPPIAAKVMVKRGDGEFPAVAMFREYAGTTSKGELTRMWATKPSVMIGKCAEALALRKAFPLDLSGLYTTDEMDQAEEATDTSSGRAHTRIEQKPHTPDTPLASQELIDEINAYAKELHMGRDQIRAVMKHCGQDPDVQGTPTVEVAEAMAEHLRGQRDKRLADQARTQAEDDSQEVIDAEIVEDAEAGDPV
ncbi:phage recombination protein Bet [Actinomycetaceae bacterium MB13-C1-2]|nr:phage recombination protein Bet [Actinomycetaceae bacterium MB13-C1-2]